MTMSGSDRESSKYTKVVEGLAKAALEGGAPMGVVGMVVGAFSGAVFGWNLMPPDTVNIVQATLALIGLVLGAVSGFVAGIVAINAFWFCLVIGILYLVGGWLFSS